ncbi:DNA adenine methylase [Xanthocytophaga flava]|uniref:DNA adenine methylase n=1 Tax=Xanthocytophaga flava TaxID=3048013 RepID=UPI0028D0D54E|nr:DNA adenine methylase [Xanthocytophaga flavus]MDJ1468172.1 DNA adenine methylase [Xanthocytophaga flavus]
MSTTTVKTKTPISYYGGKQKLASFIVSLLPEHSVYVEPFFGGGAVFWQKPSSKHEVINDLNHQLITFYKVLKYRFEEFSDVLDETFHSRAQHAYAKKVYRDDTIEDDILKAWAVFVQTNSSFGNKIAGGYRFDRAGQSTKAYNRKKEAVQTQKEYKDRLQNVNIECQDALKVIDSYDSESTVFYCDPPYIESDCGHYTGYTPEAYAKLLTKLSTIKGKFILSSYPDPILESFTRRMNWNQIEKQFKISVNNRPGTPAKIKTEVITMNYSLN